MLISQGRDIAVVAELAGDTVEVIAKVYAHAFAERKAAAMDEIGDAFAQLAGAAPKLRLVEAAN